MITKAKTLQKPWQAYHVVAMPVSNENPGYFAQSQPCSFHLALGSLTTVKQQALSLVPNKNS
jgi:hypothetical protein